MIFVHVNNFTSQNNFFIKAASFVTEIFTSTEKAHAQTVAPVNVGPGESQVKGFVPAIIVHSIPHEPAFSNQVTIDGNNIVLENGHNNLYMVFTAAPNSAFDPSHSTGTANLLSLSSTPGSVPSYTNESYFMVDAGHGITLLSPGGSTSTPGFLSFSSGTIIGPPPPPPGGGPPTGGPPTGGPPPPPPPPQVPGPTTLLLESEVIPGSLAVSATVPSSVVASVSEPANSLLVYNEFASSNPFNLITFSDYSQTSFINSISGEQNLGNIGFTSPSGFIFNTSTHLALL